VSFKKVTFDPNPMPKKKKEVKPIEKDGDDSSEDDGFKISNPNRAKPLQKTSPEEANKIIKEQIEQDKKDRKQMKLMKEGKTAAAKAELAKLDEVRKRRDEAKKEKNEEDKLRKEKEMTAKGKK